MPLPKESQMLIEHISGHIVETQEATRNGQPVGRVSGLLTTFVPDRPVDSRNLPKRFERTAFDATLAEHKARGDRPVRLLLEHTELIGGFPLEMISLNNDGLHATGEINLNTQIGRETFALASQKVLTDFSIGYSITSEHEEKGDRIADSVDLFEASIVSEPANQSAKITSLESLTPRELERALLATGRFTRSLAKELAIKLLHVEVSNQEDHSELHISLNQEEIQKLLDSMNELRDYL